jgi:hypothetical protein
MTMRKYEETLKSAMALARAASARQEMPRMRAGHNNIAILTGSKSAPKASGRKELTP